MVKETYLINEAAKEVHVESHVLRYWEEELELPIKRNPQGHRIYTQEDIDKFIKIKNLKDKGLQLKAVKTFLSDNPFAQKQLTKISKATVEGVENDHNENHRDESDYENTAHSELQPKKTGIEIKSIKSVMKPKNEVSEVKATTEEQTQRLQYLFQKLVKEAVAENNEEIISRIVERISDSVKGDVCKELDYQFRLFEERDEERMTNRMSIEDKRNEDYYKRIDELLSQYRGKGRFAKKEKEKEKEEKTINFPLTGKEKEPKAKKEFRLFKKTPEAKFQ
ncbi:MAG: MerR family transcriptional regulator [Lachnospiraceae bacterium]|nr:MerR family transcriptional regulator [Lachnospiraceae bacterium]